MSAAAKADIVRCAMSRQEPPPSPERPHGDPWRAFSYLVTGVAVYGILGWLLDQWLGTTFLVGAGLVLGAGLGLYLTFRRFAAPHASPSDQ